MPHNLETERYVLGSMISDSEILDFSIDLLNEESFFDEKNKIIFSVLKKMRNENIPIEIAVLSKKLNDSGDFNRAGGINYLSDVINSLTSTTTAEYYIQELKKLETLRALLISSNNIKDMISKGDIKTEEILEKAEAEILRISLNKSSDYFKETSDVLKNVEEELEFLRKNKNEVTGLKTGFKDFDSVTTGLKEGQLIIIAGRPGIGKTVAATNIAINMAKNGKTVALFNLEMTAEQLVTRMISTISMVDQNKLQTGFVSKEDWSNVNQAMTKLTNYNIYFDDTPALSIGALKSKCRKLASKKGLDVIIIDYLQILTTSKNYNGNRNLEVGDISRSLKQLAMELKVPVIALAQLRRPESKAIFNRPTMTELRESGQIEQDADIIVLLNRSDYYKNNSKSKEENGSMGESQNIEPYMEFNIEKNRHGPTKDIKLAFRKKIYGLFNYKEDYSSTK